MSLGADPGADTDDDGIPDNVEIQQEFLTGRTGTSPVHSMDPFIKRSALITSAAGIAVPDPEGNPVRGYSPLLHQRDWTIECYVKLLATNCTGNLILNPGPANLTAVTYQLSLSNNAPRIAFHSLGGVLYYVDGLPIPTNRWTHIAGVWDHAQNCLSLYVDGIFLQQTRIYEEACPDGCIHRPLR